MRLRHARPPAAIAVLAVLLATFTTSARAVDRLFIPAANDRDMVYSARDHVLYVAGTTAVNGVQTAP